MATSFARAGARNPRSRQSPPSERMPRASATRVPMLFTDAVAVAAAPASTAEHPVGIPHHDPRRPVGTRTHDGRQRTEELAHCAADAGHAREVEDEASAV